MTLTHQLASRWPSYNLSIATANISQQRLDFSNQITST